MCEQLFFLQSDTQSDSRIEGGIYLTHALPKSVYSDEKSWICYVSCFLYLSKIAVHAPSYITANDTDILCSIGQPIITYRFLVLGQIEAGLLHPIHSGGGFPRLFYG